MLKAPHYLQPYRSRMYLIPISINILTKFLHLTMCVSYISDCPTADDPAYDPPRVKRATGIPKSFLKSVEANTAGAMLGPEGNYVVFHQSE
jgi:hypothetical protein